MTKKNSLISIFVLIIMLSFFTGCIPKMSELELNKDERLYAGYGEMCKSQYMENGCAEGLECIAKSTKPHFIGFCYPPGYVYEEDFVNRHTYQGNPDFLNSSTKNKNISN